MILCYFWFGVPALPRAASSMLATGICGFGFPWRFLLNVFIFASTLFTTGFGADSCIVEFCRQIPSAVAPLPSEEHQLITGSRRLEPLLAMAAIHRYLPSVHESSVILKDFGSKFMIPIMGLFCPGSEPVALRFTVGVRFI